MDAEDPHKKGGNDPPGGPGTPSAPGAPGIPEIEEQITRFWEENRIFEKSLENTKDGAPYTFYDGPPFATGLPHYGHILVSTIKDLIPRYQTMRGRFVRRRWGWDCHGLPIENLVEKKLNISGKKQIEEVGIQTFNETCRSMVLQYAEEWGKMVRRMGRWVDFENSYKTMDQDYMESVWWAFKQVHDKGLAYEGRKVLLYCPRCETPISNFEVAMDNSYKEVTEESAYVKFKVKGEEDAYLLAWTTTPWTLPGNVALAVGEEIDYVKARTGKETFIVAKALAEKVLPAGHEILSEVKGKDLLGLAYEPLFNVPDVAASDKSFRVYPADFVTTEDGTGIVHTAVVYGEDDYKLGLREGLPVVPLLDEKGHFNDKAPELVRGQYFKKSEKAVKDDLEARGLLLKREPYAHSYPHCWRCGTALFYNAIPAWFINVQKVKPELLKTNEEQISWFPEHLKHGRYQKSVEAAPDWNISRNRYWGNPIPVWKCDDCGKDTVAGSLDDVRSRSIKKNEFIFVRHGEADHNVQGICGPSEDTPEYTSHLTDPGRKVADETGRSLADKKIDMIVASPLVRMRETVDILGKHVKAPVEFDERLKDRSHGPRLLTEAEWRQMSEYGKDKFNIASPGGETWNDVKARMAGFFRDINSKHSGKTILIATHGDPLWLSQIVLRGLGDDAALRVSYPETGRAYEFDWSPLPLNDRGEVDLHRPYIDDILLKCDHCGGTARRIPEIFDSWVEAGSMPFSEYHYPFENKEVFESRFPAQFVTEYIAQTRAWFYVMHVVSQIVFGRAPFENVLTTGTILAEDGSKMSKSKNNYPDPWLVIDKYGVDTLRFYLMNSVVMQAENLNFSMKDMESAHRKAVLILWNVQQYFLTYAGPQPANIAALTGPEAHVLDRWITARIKELVATVTDSLDGCDTVRATRAIAEFIDDLSTWYLRRSRGREDAGFFPAFRRTLMTVSQVIAPVMPHIAEAIYQSLRAETDPESVHLSAWPEKEELNEEEKKLGEEMKVAREAASWVLMFRKASNIPVRQPIARMALVLDDKMELPQDLLDVLLSELNIKTFDPGIIGMQGMHKIEATPHPIREIWIDPVLTEDLKLEGEVRKLERAIQEKRKELGLKVGELARLVYSAGDADSESAFKAVDTKKTYVAEIKKGAGGASGTFELERI